MLKLHRFSVGVDRLLILEQVLDHLVDGQGVQVLDDQVEDEPVADLLSDTKGLWVQDRLDVGSFNRFPAL